MHTDSKDVLALVKRAHPRFTGKSCKVEVYKPIVPASYWSGGYRDYYALVRLNDSDEVLPVRENGSGFVRDTGVLPNIPKETALIKFTLGPRCSATVFVNPENMPAALPDSLELSTIEQTTLNAIRCFKASYRREWLALRDIMLDKVIPSLYEKGLVNKAGAITVKGRNLAQSVY